MEYRELYERLASIINNEDLKMETALNVVSNIQLQLMLAIGKESEGEAKDALLAMLDNIRNIFLDKIEQEEGNRSIIHIGEA